MRDGDSRRLRNSVELQKNNQSPSFSSKMSTTLQSSSQFEVMNRNSDFAHMSAGELLGRTHEELVLLLIQLRRQNASTYHAIERLNMEIEAQARLVQIDVPCRLENVYKLQELKKNIIHLEKEYEKKKPLVNLVDNMVKLGSLYNRNDTSNRFYQPQINTIVNQKERIEFNQWIQDKKLLAEEKKDWKRFNSDCSQLQFKVQQLYKLDKLLQEESTVLQNLQHDKKILEKKLLYLRYKIHSDQTDSGNLEKHKKQQAVLEKELSKIRILLAHNSKKLEETVAENAQLEQELIILKQKFQTSQKYLGNIVRDSSNTTTDLEIELMRVQNLVGNLQKQREELSSQVKQLTEKSHSLIEQMSSKESSKLQCTTQINYSKKRNDSTWLETDLDSGNAYNHGLNSNSSSFISLNNMKDSTFMPQQLQYDEISSGACSSILSLQQIKSNNSNSMYNIHNHIKNDSPNVPRYHRNSSVLSSEVREQIQQHQSKQQLLIDQMQGKFNPILIQKNIHHLISSDCKNHKNNTDNINNLLYDNAYHSQSEYIHPSSSPSPPLKNTLSHIPSKGVLINNTMDIDDNYKFNELNHNREKFEIKTVRIVKRESERRHKDRNGLSLMNGFLHFDETKQFIDKEHESAKINKINERHGMRKEPSNCQFSLQNNFHPRKNIKFLQKYEEKDLKSLMENETLSVLSNEDMIVEKNKHFYQLNNAEESSDSVQSLHAESPSNSLNNYPIIYKNCSSSENFFENELGLIKSNLNTMEMYGDLELWSPKNLPTQSITKVSSKMSNSFSQSPQLSPIFKSEAAKEIIKEMAEEKFDPSPKKRFIPKRKRRHYTVSSSKPLLDLDDIYYKTERSRARDDIDMERALKPGSNTPDVVRSTFDHKEFKYNEMTIDQLFGAPNKIIIPERYIPEKTPELSMEEKKQRSEKVTAIRKMLSKTTITPTDDRDNLVDLQKIHSFKKKAAEERKQRDHILQLNQILAKQVMEKSKMVAVKALLTMPLQLANTTLDGEDLSPIIPLPLYQQREMFYS